MYVCVWRRNLTRFGDCGLAVSDNTNAAGVGYEYCDVTRLTKARPLNYHTE
jgi:hypothetical protein